ncbi:Transglycosylase SLT domain [Serratia fonticola]|uniref:lytic transglycosylase domain-containing protein n=1 Tax=Serratia fonticola TaxID=47917 RepID=UPI0021773F40|nr:lytic transglycosylase domain-containing protein [Serratia fonticola]CAI1823909.1 Transglycosylase SLT domain [Serratia fonticola]
MSENIPVITIPVDNEQLKEALSLIEKLSAAAERFNSKYGSPLDTGAGRGWGGVPPGGVGGGNAGGASGDDSGDGAGKGFLNNVNKLAKAVEKSFDQVNKTLGKTIGMLKGLFESAISWGLKMALLGTGSAFGYNMIAKNAGQQLMTAQGNKMTTGQMQAAKNVYGNRFSGVDSLIQGLNSANSDVSSPYRPGLMSLGLNPLDSPGKNLPLLIQKLSDLAASDNGSGMAYSRINALKLGGMVSQTELNQYGANQDIIPGLNNRFETTAKTLQMSDKDNRSFQSVSTTFDTNTDIMFNSFKTALATLNEPIEKLSKTFTDAVDSFLSGPNGKAVFEELKNGVESFSAWINKPQFQEDLKSFSTAVTEIVKAIGRAVIWIGGMVGGSDKKDGETDVAYQARKQKERTDAMAADKEKWEITGEKLSNWVGDIFSKTPDPAAVMLNQQLTGEPEQHAQRVKKPAGKRSASWHDYSQLESQHGLPQSFLSAVEQVESSGNPWAIGPMTKYGQAKGAFQFMDPTAAEMGLRGGEVFDREKSATAAAKYFAKLSKKYDGDPLMMLAAYNWGQGNLDKHGLAKMPDETRRYLEKILPQIGQSDQLARIQQSNADSRIVAGTQSRMVIDVALNQAPGSDINAQLRSNMPPPINIPF